MLHLCHIDKPLRESDNLVRIPLTWATNLGIYVLKTENHTAEETEVMKIRIEVEDSYGKVEYTGFLVSQKVRPRYVEVDDMLGYTHKNPTRVLDMTFEVEVDKIVRGD